MLSQRFPQGAPLRVPKTVRTRRFDEEASCARRTLSDASVVCASDALRWEASERALRQSSPRLQWWPPICADMGGRGVLGLT
jgi:hypothetical protein